MNTSSTAEQSTAISVSLIALLILSLLFVGARGSAGLNQFEILSHLRLAKQHLSDLGQQIVLTRHDLLPHYDAISRSELALKSDIAALQANLSHIDTPTLIEAVKPMNGLYAEQSAEIEDFKSANAILKNSLRYLPDAEADLANALSDANQANLKAQTENLGKNVLIFNLTASPELHDSILQDANRLNQALATSEWRTLSNGLHQHINTIVEYKTRLDLQVSQLLDSPLRATIVNAEQIYLLEQQVAADLQNRYRYALTLYAALLLGSMGYLGYRYTVQADQFKHQATHDSLTGLYNRVQLHFEISRLIEHADQGGRGFTLFLIDLDRFKEVNDTLGHQSGDLLIKEIGPRIQISLPNSYVSRLGGDEFAVLLPGVDQTSEAEAQAIVLRKALSQPFTIGTIVLEVSASLGIARYPEQGANGHELLRHADVAMYAAKQGGGYVHYASNLDIHTPRRLTMMTDLSRAIREQQLELHYQPKVDLRSKTVTSVEALLRWHHPELGTISPAEFVPLAEMSDTIHPLTRWVIEMAACQIRIWEKNGLKLNVAINLSARNLLDDSLPQHIRKILEDCRVSPERMEMEITESAIMADPRRAIRVLEQIDQMGIRLAIDDFGTGYSSLAYLVRLPVDCLKLDRTFVAGFLQQRGEAAIVLSTVQLAHNLGLSVVAEGAEDAATVAALIHSDYDMVQGYYFCKPLTATELQDWLASGALDKLFENLEQVPCKTSWA